MNKYSCLREALSFVCPICHLKNYIGKNYFEIELTKAQTLKVDIDSNRIIEAIINYEQDFVQPNINSSYYNMNYNGITYYGVRRDCLKCFQYELTIQVSINYKTYMIEDLVKNCEAVTIEENNSTYEIRNSYGVNKTTYRNNRDESIYLPLVSEDLLNPKETLLKIKKLIPFI